MKVQSMFVITTAHYKDHSILTTSDKIINCFPIHSMLFYFQHNDNSVSSNLNTAYEISRHSFCHFPKKVSKSVIKINFIILLRIFIDAEASLLQFNCNGVKLPLTTMRKLECEFS